MCVGGLLIRKDERKEEMNEVRRGRQSRDRIRIRTLIQLSMCAVMASPYTSPPVSSKRRRLTPRLMSAHCKSL